MMACKSWRNNIFINQNGEEPLSLEKSWNYKEQNGHKAGRREKGQDGQYGSSTRARYWNAETRTNREEKEIESRMVDADILKGLYDKGIIDIDGKLI